MERIVADSHSTNRPGQGEVPAADEASSAAALRRKGRRLGRGLASLISVPPPPADVQEPQENKQAATPAPAEASPPAERKPDAARPADQAPPSTGVELARLATSAIEPNPHQPRRTFNDDALAGLADSLKANGMLQPVLVRPRAGASEGAPAYQLVAGERRWRAAKLAGLEAVPAIVQRLGDDAMLELALIENIQREDLNALERAAAYRAILQRTGMSQDTLAKRLGDSRANVGNYLRLLDLPAAVQEMVADGRLSFGQARPLGALKRSETMVTLAEAAVARGWSARQIEQFVAALVEHPAGEESLEELLGIEDIKAAGKTPPKKEPPPKPSNIVALEEKLTHRLGTRVLIKQGRRADMGKLVIDFYCLDDFDRILDALGVVMDD